MAQDNKIHLPSGQGGLTRYSENMGSKIELSPGLVIVLIVIILALVILLNQFGGAFFQ